jgi:hypothetical protein
MNDALRAAGIVALVLFVLSPGAAIAGVNTPELDPSLTIGGLALLGGTAAFVIERYRRRAK